MPWKAFLKIIGPVIFIFILSQVDFRALLSVFKDLNLFYFFLAFLFWFFHLLIRIFKWKMLIDVLGERVAFSRLFSMFAKGVFLGIITPGKIGEFYRAKYLAEQTNLSLRKSFATVILDRITDILGAAFIGLLAVLVLIYGLKVKVPQIAGLFLLIIFVLIIYFLVRKKQSANIFSAILKIFLPGPLLEKSQESVGEFFRDLKKFSALLFVKVFLFEVIVYYLFIALANFFLAVSLGFSIPLWYLYLIDPIIALLIVLPISFLGVGTREAGYVFLLAPFNIGLNQAVVFSLMIMFLNILIALPGLILYLFKIKLPFYHRILTIKDAVKSLFISRPKEKIVEYLKNYFDSKYVLLSKSGRQAIKLILESLDLKKGDEVILPSFICQVAEEAVLRAGGRPVFCPIEKGGFNLDFDSLEKLINPKTRVIILVHTFGVPAKVDKFLQLAREHNIVLIEDCAHALGAKYNDVLLGKFGDFAVFSFGFSKNVGGLGGGFILAKDGDNFQKLEKKFLETAKKKSFSFGEYLEVFLMPLVWNRYFYFFFEGLVGTYGKIRRERNSDKEFDSFISDLEARVALQKLKRYQSDLEKRNKNAILYQEELKDFFALAPISPKSEPAFPYFPVLEGEEKYRLLKKKDLPVERLDFMSQPDYFLLPLNYSPEEIRSIIKKIKEVCQKFQ